MQTSLCDSSRRNSKECAHEQLGILAADVGCGTCLASCQSLQLPGRTGRQACRSRKHRRLVLGYLHGIACLGLRRTGIDAFVSLGLYYLNTRPASYIYFEYPVTTLGTCGGPTRPVETAGVYRFSRARSLLYSHLQASFPFDFGRY